MVDYAGIRSADKVELFELASSYNESSVEQEDATTAFMKILYRNMKSMTGITVDEFFSVSKDTALYVSSTLSIFLQNMGLSTDKAQYLSIKSVECVIMDTRIPAAFAHLEEEMENDKR